MHFLEKILERFSMGVGGKKWIHAFPKQICAKNKRNRQSRNLNSARPVSIFRAVNFYAYRTSTFMHINEATLSVLAALFIRSSTVISWSCAVLLFFFFSFLSVGIFQVHERQEPEAESVLQFVFDRKQEKNIEMEKDRKKNKWEKEKDWETKHLNWRYYNDSLEQWRENVYITEACND